MCDEHTNRINCQEGGTYKELDKTVKAPQYDWVTKTVLECEVCGREVYVWSDGTKQRNGGLFETEVEYYSPKGELEFVESNV